MSKVITDEIEGGIYMNDRHNRPAGFAAELEKYLEATLAAARPASRKPFKHVGAAEIDQRGGDTGVRKKAVGHPTQGFSRPSPHARP
ncbi:MAG: hypothetical protein ORN51_12145 [Akkermansiaceae bacterium]|nr:hypothetical protein [Akkermansiaceae bacterium]